MKRIESLRPLSDDHHTALVLARRCARVGRSGAGAPRSRLWDDVRSAFATHLEPHFTIEEAHLLPALVAVGEDRRADRIRRDHAALRGLVAHADADAERIARFGRLLRDHVRYEEREVFEPLQHRLPAASLERIAEACRTVPRACPTGLLQDA